jgi:crotonobetainyl-CoA:carnitine CoA-transferase CaiB-like acyl-CoA transferase
MTSFLEGSGRQMTFPPRFGEHNNEYYERLGLSDEDIAKLRAEGII